MNFFRESDSSKISKIIKLLEDENRTEKRSEIICRLSKLSETHFKEKDAKPEILFNAIVTGDDDNYYDIMIIKIIIEKLKNYLFVYNNQYDMFATQKAIAMNKNNFANIIFDAEIYSGTEIHFFMYSGSLKNLQNLLNALKLNNNEKNQRIKDIIEGIIKNEQSKKTNALSVENSGEPDIVYGMQGDDKQGGAKRKSNKRSKKNRKTKRRRHTRR
jgi:hypothetical protein